MRKTKRKTIAQLKKKLTEVFNAYIRQRDKGQPCYACGKQTDNMHASHYVPSTYGPTRYNEMNVHSCCPACNLFKHGNLIAYRETLVLRYGNKAVEELELSRHEPWKWGGAWLEEAIQKYTDLLKG